MNKAYSVLNAINGKLSALMPTHLKEVRRNRLDPIQLGDYPVLVIRMGPDTPRGDSINFITSDFTVHTDIYVNSTDSDLDKLTLDIRAEVHKALMADKTQGLDFVIDTKHSLQQEPDYTGEGDDYAGATRLSWEVTYRYTYNDPSL